MADPGNSTLFYTDSGNIYILLNAVLIRFKKKRLVIFVTGRNDGHSSGLRGYKLAAKIKKYSTLVLNHEVSLPYSKFLVSIVKPEYVYFQMLRCERNDIRHFCKYKTILDMDDADFFDERLSEKYDQNARIATLCIAGSQFIADWMKKRNNSVEIIWTGSDPVTVYKPIKDTQDIILSWACSTPFNYPMEAEFVKRLIIELRKKKPIHFYLIGVQNEEEGRSYLREIDQEEVNLKQFPFMNYSALLKVLEKVDIGLAPLFPGQNPFSSGKSFGKVLAYLNAETVCVASNTMEYPLFFRHGINGFLCNENLEDWIQTVEPLLGDPERRRNIGFRGKKDYINQLSLKASSSRLENILLSKQ